jgi:hypothetical protein
MSKSTERQFQEADAAVERTVKAFMGKVEQMRWRWEAVAPTYIIHHVLDELCEEVTKLIDDPALADHVLGPATIKLSNALADYRDSPLAERG